MELELAPQVKQSLYGRWEPICRSQLHYLVTLNTRGRRPVLKDRHVEALRELIEQACDERDVALVDFAAGADHAHVLFALQPAQSVGSAVREIKGRAGVALMSRFPELRVWLRGNLLWDERYAVETVSGARIERVRERLQTVHRTHLPPFGHEDLAEAS